MKLNTKAKNVQQSAHELKRPVQQVHPVLHLNAMTMEMQKWASHKLKPSKAKEIPRSKLLELAKRWHHPEPLP